MAKHILPTNDKTELNTWQWKDESNPDPASHVMFSDRPLELKTKE
jgi:hypothetical protein